MDSQTITELALEAQKREVFRAMLEHYVGGGRKIAKWDDTRFRLVCINSWSINSATTLSTKRRNLDKLAAAGVIDRWKSYKGSAISYRFPRSVCDQLAAEAIAHYTAIGYSPDEIRPEISP